MTLRHANTPNLTETTKALWTYRSLKAQDRYSEQVIAKKLWLLRQALAADIQVIDEFLRLSETYQP